MPDRAETARVANLWDANGDLRDQLADIEASPENTHGLER